MSVSLYDVTVKTYLQILPKMGHLVDKAEAHCRENGLPDEALTGASLGGDMWNFAKQIFECGHHSARAIQSVRSGVAGPEIGPAPLDFAALKQEVTGAIDFVKTVAPDEFDGIAGRDVRFEFTGARMDYTVEDFILSFSLPSFYFHSMAAYCILRNRGLDIGKRDYLGKVRLKK